MENFDLKKYLAEGNLSKESPSTKPEEIVKNVETYFTSDTPEEFYYITYKGTPIAPKGKLKTFKTQTRAMGYINTEISWKIKEALPEDEWVMYADSLPKDYISSVRNLISPDIEIIKI